MSFLSFLGICFLLFTDLGRLLLLGLFLLFLLSLCIAFVGWTIVGLIFLCSQFPEETIMGIITIIFIILIIWLGKIEEEAKIKGISRWVYLKDTIVMGFRRLLKNKKV